MRRLTFFRVLIPAVLVVFVALLVWALQAPVAVHVTPVDDGTSGEAARGLEVTELDGPDTSLKADAERVEQLEDGGFHFEQINRIEIFRDKMESLIVKSEVGDVAGPPGRRVMRFETGVTLYDPEQDLELTLPVLDVDEEEGKARSKGEVRLEGPNLSGRASGLVYSLQGEPTELFDLELWDAADARLVAASALLLDGLDDVELRQAVRATRPPEERLEAERMRIIRRGDHLLRRVSADGGVSGSVLSSSGDYLKLQAEQVDADWDAQGAVERFALRGHAEVRQGTQSLSAESIAVERGAAPDGGWKVDASGTVFGQVRIQDQPAWLRAETLQAGLGPDLQLQTAEAAGAVRFEGPRTRAESERATVEIVEGRGEIRLLSAARRKARLSRGPTRVAAESIVTDPRGERLLAERKVEATLLVEDGGAGDAQAVGLFRSDEATHFVASRLEGSDSGGRLVFSGEVRGWQGEQNLAAGRVTMDRASNAMSARDDVTTRILRDRSGTGEGNYLIVEADALDYSDVERRAVYEGGVRVRMLEGWMEADRMEVDLRPDSGIREVRAAGNIRIEFSEADKTMLIAGQADRLLYTPADETVKLFGERAPATVRRIGEGGGTTQGRVLRYRLGDGTLEVDSGEQGPARIRAPGGSS